MTHGVTLPELVSLLCADAVRMMHIQDRVMDDPSDAGESTEVFMLGKVIGLRRALCLAKGWDPHAESDTGGRADQFIRNWHNLPGHCSVAGCGMWR